MCQVLGYQMTRMGATPVLSAFYRKRRNSLLSTFMFSVWAGNTVLILMVWPTRIFDALCRVYFE